MSFIVLLSIVVVGLCIGIVYRWKQVRDRREVEENSITPEALYTLMNSGQKKVLIYDVRQPLDVLADSEIIPGAKRISPKEVMANPALIPQDEDSIVYCTCPSDKTSRLISKQARAAHFFRVRFLRGGLDAWKAKGYPVVPYDQTFHLDTSR